MVARRLARGDERYSGCGQKSRLLTYDSEEYDDLFPSLAAANPPVGRNERVSKRSRKGARKCDSKQRSDAASVADGIDRVPQPSGKPTKARHGEQNHPQDERHRTEQRDQNMTHDKTSKQAQLEGEMTAPRGQPLELLQPTVYTPPTSTVEIEFQYDATKYRRETPSASSTGRPRGVPVMPRMPPTPRTGRRMVRALPVPKVQTNARAVGSRNTEKLIPLYAPVPCLPPFDGGILYPPVPSDFGPPFMPVPTYPLPMPPILWYPSLPPPPPPPGMMMSTPPVYGEPIFPLIPLSLAGHGQQVQVNANQPSRDLGRQATRDIHHESIPIGIDLGPASAMEPKGAVKVTKQPARAQSLNPGFAITLGDSHSVSIAQEEHQFQPLHIAGWEKAGCNVLNSEISEASSLSLGNAGKCSKAQLDTHEPHLGVNTPNVGSLANQQRHKFDQHDNVPSLRCPPLDAPTAPSAQRRGLPLSATVTRQSHGSSNLPPGAWSQSKRWTSKPTQEKQAFQKMVTNLRYMGADQSPFVPQTPAELTAFKVSIAETMKIRLVQEVEKRIARSSSKSPESVSDNQDHQLGKFLGGKVFSDHLSPFFAAVTCFNKDLPTDDHLCVDWPCLAELKEEGDKRATRFGRSFPQPRLNIPARRFDTGRYEDAYNVDGSIPWEKKAFKVGYQNDFRPVTQPEDAFDPPEEFEVGELPRELQVLLEDIDETDTDEKEGDREKNDTSPKALLTGNS